MTSRLLVIRFSSFGDIVQAAGVPRAFLNAFPGALKHDGQVDWLTRADFAGLVRLIAGVSHVHEFKRESGLLGLLRLAWQLAGTNTYSHVYDAHNNLRSKLFTTVFRVRSTFARIGGDRAVRFATRPKNRLRRWLFFRFRLPVLPKPFRGANSFHEPLAKWGLSKTVLSGEPVLRPGNLPARAASALADNLRPWIVCAPSAAWEMKRWPTAHWSELMRAIPQASFIFLGGPEDRFIDDLVAQARADGARAVNLAGQLSLAESIAVVAKADLAIANDTGLLHVADQLERPTIALIGPTAFGYPSHPKSVYLETPLWCQPCSKDGRGGCRNSLYKRCLVELTSARVAGVAANYLSGDSTP